MFFFPIGFLPPLRNNSHGFFPRNPNSERRRNSNQLEVENDYEYDSNDNESFSNGEKLNEKIGNFKSLEYLLSIPGITISDNDNKEENKNKLTLVDFQKRNLNNFKEDLIYYFSTPESMKHFKNSLEEEIKYEFYKDLDCVNFISVQKERFKRILSILESDLDSPKKLTKFNNFCSLLSLIKNDNQTQEKLIKANIIGLKLGESFSLYSQKEINEDKIIIYLNELKDTFVYNNINMESIGLIHFSAIEKNLISILLLIENKLLVKWGVETLTKFCLIGIDILKNFRSTKLYFYIIRFLKQYKNILDFTQINQNKEMIQFIPNNCFDFSKLHQIKKELINDLREPLIKKNLVTLPLENIQLNLKDYITLSYDDYLLLFISDKIENESKVVNNEDIYFYFKIDLFG